jgi:hypothetical protein
MGRVREAAKARWRHSRPPVPHVDPVRRWPNRDRYADAVSGRRKARFSASSVSALLALQYGALVIWPAFTNHSPYLKAMLGMVTIGIVSAFAGERIVSVITYRSKPKEVSGWSWCTPKAAGTVLALGLIALILSPFLGIGTYSTQVGATNRSLLAPAVTPLLLLVPIGVAMLLFCFLQETASRKFVLGWLGVAIIAHAGYSVLIFRTAPLAAFTLSTLAACVVVGVVRARMIVIAMVAATLMWPTFYAIRNADRQGLGGDSYGQAVSASDRLREDLLMQDAIRIGRPVDIGQASILDTLRYGLVPRIIDSGRPDVSTGGKLSAVLGGSSRSSSTFTILGNIYSLGGGLSGLIAAPFLVAGGVVLLLRRTNPLTLALALGTWTSLVWIESTWPDGLAGTLQILPSALVVFGVVRACQFVDSELASRLVSLEETRHRARRAAMRADKVRAGKGVVIVPIASRQLPPPSVNNGLPSVAS